MIKAIFFDVDGTLIDMKNGGMPESTLEALNILHTKGIKLIISSGRHKSLMEMQKEMFHGINFDAYILLNGQYCTDGDMNPFYTKTIKKEGLKKFVAYIKAGNTPYRFFEEDYYYDSCFNEREYNYMVEMGYEDYLAPIDDPIRSYDKNTYQISAFISKDKDEEVLNSFPNVKIVRWNDSSADIIPIDGGKEVGMKEVLKHFKIDEEETMAFGDGGNDIGMLKFVKIGVAMGNALEELKEVADYITDDIDKDGLYNALKHFEII